MIEIIPQVETQVTAQQKLAGFPRPNIQKAMDQMNKYYDFIEASNRAKLAKKSLLEIKKYWLSNEVGNSSDYILSLDQDDWLEHKEKFPWAVTRDIEHKTLFALFIREALTAPINTKTEVT